MYYVLCTVGGSHVLFFSTFFPMILSLKREKNNLKLFFGSYIEIIKIRNLHLADFAEKSIINLFMSYAIEEKCVLFSTNQKKGK